jgi:hypothetical protein
MMWTRTTIRSAVVGLCMLAAGCGDYTIDLPGGYLLVRVSSEEVLISDPRHVVVIMPTVDLYNVQGHLVVGHVSVPNLPPDPDPPRGEKAKTRPGYFVINTQTREVKDGLEKRMWLELLQTLGVKAQPDLKRPSRFDRYF